MRRIAIINQKGGVGKTTTTANLAAALARAGRRVLLFDLDPQAHLSLHLGLDPSSGRPGVYELLTGSASIAKVRVKAAPNLWMVGASIDLAAAEVELVSVLGREVLLRDLLDQHVGNGEKDGRFTRYDYVLFDCPPSLGVLTLNGLCAAQEVIIPLQPHFLALQGLGKLLETVLLVSKRISPGIKVAGIVICMYDAGTKLGAEVIEDVRSFLESARHGNMPWSGARLFETIIRRNIKLAESPSHGKSIFDYAPDSNGAKDYERMARELHDPTRLEVETAEDVPAELTSSAPMAADPLATEVARQREKLSRPAAPPSAEKGRSRAPAAEGAPQSAV
ncbi:MAG TPA: AAA family ATPase [Phycisphaerae bacterium]|nr:AAA family ATPase [Phycisphaerae bacterium]